MASLWCHEIVCQYLNPCPRLYISHRFFTRLYGPGSFPISLQIKPTAAEEEYLHENRHIRYEGNIVVWIATNEQPSNINSGQQWSSAAPILDFHEIENPRTHSASQDYFGQNPTHVLSPKSSDQNAPEMITVSKEKMNAMVKEAFAKGHVSGLDHASFLEDMSRSVHPTHSKFHRLINHERCADYNPNEGYNSNADYNPNADYNTNADYNPNEGYN
jgi:hypothetical protein